MIRLKLATWMVVAGLLAMGCQSAYYAVWETFGKEKRHLLKSRVDQAREDQAEASEQFKDTLTRIREMYGFDGGELEAGYEKLKNDYEVCEIRANDVRERMDAVEEIAADLFEEWADELEEIETPDLRARSERSLVDARKRYERLETSMKAAEASMTPVLRKLKDYVLYLKHNLNAQAIGALKGEMSSIETEIASLVAAMNRSISEADAFLKTF